MSLFYQHTISPTTKLGIWQIEESEDFFLQKVPLSQTITHPHKRLQHLAGRYLLHYLFPDFPYTEILIADTRKPYLQNEQYHFSISHCGNYAAAIVSATNRAGIDIEIPSEKVVRVAHKFVHPAEQNFIENGAGQNSIIINHQQLTTINQQPLTILWCAKEAIYKWYSHGSVDFKNHIQLIQPFQFENNELLLPFYFKKHDPVFLTVHARVFNELVLSYLV